MKRLLTIDAPSSQWTNDTLTFLSGFSGARRSHAIANKDRRSQEVAIVEAAHPHQREAIIQAIVPPIESRAGGPVNETLL